MCTLILGRDVIAPGTVLLAANRDEDPRRPTDPPGVLGPNPRVVGGRDKVAGGTWLAVRGREAAIAMLNRYDPSARDTRPPSGVRARELRSRGLLALDVATVAEDFPERIDLPPEHRRLLEAIHARSGSRLPGAALSRAWVGVSEGAYAPFTLVFAAPEACWLLALDAGQPPRIEAIGEGWHVITHRDLDDRAEPRTARVLDALAGFKPGSVDEAIERLGGLLRAHDPPPVCLHEGRMVTVSSSMVWLARDDARYLHAEGRPCERPYQDRTPLLIHHPHVEATMKLENQVALVTGASRGLGLSIARALAAEGAAVSCVARPGAGAGPRHRGAEGLGRPRDHGPRRRHPRGRRRGRGAPHGRDLGPARPRDPQRRHLAGRPAPRDHRGAVGPADRPQPQGCVPHPQARPALADRAAPRHRGRDRLARRAGRPAGLRRLRGQQVGAARACSSRRRSRSASTACGWASSIPTT